ncbi:MAG: hypothetical protein J6X48_01435 [Lachnospiraceae bacterium]|jgi:hypothetical protein|nr:hypothetical protein [Lachnospiraceae bacterium]MBP5598926.1 hypothetical protein [Lachnospiraceae bacterium]MBQ3891119.1 hypothetical protein [Lachnospiraceae bacterium]
MDSFMDKIAGRFANSADVIKANSEAEAKKLEEYKQRVEELEKAVSDMRRLSFKCVETNEATTQLVQGAIEKIEEMRGNEGGLDSEELSKIVTDLNDLKASVEASFKAAEDEAHKENVRVYRNVQASLIEELKQQSEAIAIQHLHIEKKIKGIKPCAIIGIVFSGITMAMMIALSILYYLKIGF